ncbi:Rdx family protein [bacterium]|nr:Rdx family protein [bacterium]
MADELKQQIPNCTIHLVKGSGGIFDVHADGELVYSKSSTFRFPLPGEVVQKLQNPG